MVINFKSLKQVETEVGKKSNNFASTTLLKLLDSYK